MAISYISEVTKSIIELIKLDYTRIEIGGTVEVYPFPPDKMSDVGLSFFLYHLQESPNHKNFPIPGNENTPVRHSPMGLILYYQLSAFTGESPSEDDFYEGYKRISVAIKTLHDNPHFYDSDKKNRFKIAIQPIPPNEAVQYWTEGNSHINLAAYYEVSMVFLEPEEITQRTGRVLQYGSFVFPEASPKITRNQNVLEYDLPNGTSNQVTVQPAQAPYGDTIEFYGTGFTGDTITLLLFSRNWKGAAKAEDWVTSLTSNKIIAEVKDTAKLEKDDSEVAVLPGVYSAQIRVERSRTLPDGTIKKFNHTSNQFPFTVTPKIEGPISGPDGNGIFSVTGKIFKHVDLSEEDVQVYLGEKRLFRNATIDPGTFHTTDGQPFQSIQLKLPDPLPGDWESGQLLPLRILINGAESPPNWITIP